MSNGIFGSIRPANININEDVEIFYMYRPTRGETSSDFEKGFKKLDPTTCLVESKASFDDKEESFTLNGMYTLKLPLNEFNKKGFYTIYIRPKEVKNTITDVSVLSTYPDIKGIIIKSDGLSNDLTGYRVEYENGESRLIKSCNYCEPVIVNTGDGYPKTTRYNLNVTTTSLLFCTLTPSSAPSFKPNSLPYIGVPGESIKIVNTKFSPKVIEVEMVTHDMDTLSYMLEGDQINDRDNAIITTYNDKHEIYHQSDYYVLKDSLGKPIYNVRKKRDNIDVNQEYEKVLNNE